MRIALDQKLKRKEYRVYRHVYIKRHTHICIRIEIFMCKYIKRTEVMHHSITVIVVSGWAKDHRQVLVSSFLLCVDFLTYYFVRRKKGFVL